MSGEVQLRVLALRGLEDFLDDDYFYITCGVGDDYFEASNPLPGPDPAWATEPFALPLANNGVVAVGVDSPSELAYEASLSIKLGKKGAEPTTVHVGVFVEGTEDGEEDEDLGEVSIVFDTEYEHGEYWYELGDDIAILIHTALEPELEPEPEPSAAVQEIFASFEVPESPAPAAQPSLEPPLDPLAAIIGEDPEADEAARIDPPDPSPGEGTSKSGATEALSPTPPATAKRGLFSWGRKSTESTSAAKSPTQARTEEQAGVEQVKEEEGGAPTTTSGQFSSGQWSQADDSPSETMHASGSGIFSSATFFGRKKEKPAPKVVEAPASPSADPASSPPPPPPSKKPGVFASLMGRKKTPATASVSPPPAPPPPAPPPPPTSEPTAAMDAEAAPAAEPCDEPSTAPAPEPEPSAEPVSAEPVSVEPVSAERSAQISQAQGGDASSPIAAAAAAATAVASPPQEKASMMSKLKVFFNGTGRSKSPTPGGVAASTAPPKLAASYRDKLSRTTHSTSGEDAVNGTSGGLKSAHVPLSQSAHDLKLHEALERRNAAAAAACLGDGAHACSVVALPTDAEPTGVPAIVRAVQWRGGGACAELLLLRGAEPTASCPGDGATLGWTAVHTAAAAGAVDCLTALLRGGGATALLNSKCTGSGSTPLVEAVMAQEVQAAEMLLQRGADVTSADTHGLSALHWAARGGDEDMVRLLLEHKADPKVRAKRRADAEGSMGVTPMHLAARNGHARVVAMLAEAGGEATVPDARGRTPLHEASHNGHVGAVDALLQQEAVADWLHTATDATGATALQWAVAGGAEAAVERLVGAAAAVAGDSVDSTRSHLDDLNMSYLLCKGGQGDTAGMRRLLGKHRKKAALALDAALEREAAVKAKAKELAAAQAKAKDVKKLPPGKRPFVRKPKA